MTSQGMSRDQKVLSLLEYALTQNGVREDAFRIGVAGDEKKVADRLCLLDQGDGTWDVVFAERGDYLDLSQHTSFRVAVRDFYWRLTRKDTPWDFIDDWELETGLSL